MPKIIIDEEDIFNFVFFPDSLSKKKLKYIESNQARFARDIEFCKKLQEDLSTPLPDSIKKKISERIVDRSRKIFRLLPAQTPLSTAIHFNSLAAASEQQSPAFLSFKDASDKVLVRLLLNENKQELFLFSREFMQGDKIRCKFIPGKETAEFVVKEQPIPIKFPEIINEILIESV